MAALRKYPIMEWKLWDKLPLWQWHNPEAQQPDRNLFISLLETVSLLSAILVKEFSFISRQVECCHANFCFPLCVATSPSVYVVKTWTRRLLITQTIAVLQENKPQKCPSLWRRLWRRVERRTCPMWRCVTEAFPTCWTFQDCVRTAHTVSQPACEKLSF